MRTGARVAILGVMMMMAISNSHGSGWTRFGKDQGLPDEAVRALCVDGTGRLWVGLLDGGIAVLDGERFKVVAAEKVGTPHVRDLAWSTRGEVWAATDEGAARIKGDQVEWMPRGTPGLNSPDLVQVVADVGGRTWLFPFDLSSGEPPGITTWDGERLSVVAVPEDARRGGFIGMANAPLPGSGGKASILLIGETGLFKLTGEGKIEAVNVEDTPLWRPSQRGRNEEEESRRVPPYYVQAARQAKDGTVWFVNPHAVVSLDAKGFRERLTHDGYPLGGFVAEGTDGTIWLLSYDKRLIGIGPGDSTQIIPVRIEGQEMFRELVAGSQGTVWVGVDGSPALVFRAKPGGTEPERFTVESGSEQAISVNAMLEDPAGNLWVASDNGLYRFGKN